jgi:FKBP-type peptidyl-prolyl cis-trans isomerase
MKKNMQIVVILIVIVIAVLVVFGFFGIGGFNLFGLTQQAPEDNTVTPQALLASVQQTGGVTTLQTADLSVGTGDTYGPGDTIAVAYTGVLPNGTIFDSTQSHGGVPLELVVAEDGSLHLSDGGGGLITGWSLGMAGMKQGGVRLLAIPPDLGYGPNAMGPIPANSTLVFQVELVSVTHPGSAAPTTSEPTPAQ